MKNKFKHFWIFSIAALIIIGITACDLFEEDDVAVTGVSLNKSSASINVGANETLTATISPNDATNKDLVWTSSNTTIATVSSNGVVTGVAVGTAVIVVSTSDGGFTATCNVTVNAAVSRPNGNGGVSVEADGTLKITADLWIFDTREANPQLRRAEANFSSPVIIAMRGNQLEIADGIKDGRLDISIDIPQNNDLFTWGSFLGEMGEGTVVEGADVLIGGFDLGGGEGYLSFVANAERRQHEGIDNGEPFLYGELFGFLYSTGNASLRGSYTENDEHSDEITYNNFDVRLASGWNSVSTSYTYELASQIHYTFNSESKSPPTGARWVLHY